MHANPLVAAVAAEHRRALLHEAAEHRVARQVRCAASTRGAGEARGPFGRHRRPATS